MPSGPNHVILAAAGASKTQYVIDTARADPSARVLITTYTNENLGQIRQRLQATTGVLPANVELMGWFSFLLAHGVRPYQRILLKRPGRVVGLNFVGRANRFIKASNPAYFVDSSGGVYREAAADLVDRIDDQSGGAVIDRLEAIYDHILIDEFQDLVGYDLEVVDRLMRSEIAVTAVGDPRQHTFATANVTKNKKYRGAGIIKWLEERGDVCSVAHRHESDRCHEDICAFASELFPEFEPVTSGHEIVTGHDGIHEISRFDALSYHAEYQPQVLRWNRTSDTQGLPAMNIGVAKGSTFDRVLIYPTRPMTAYLKNRDPKAFNSREKLYVAVTRARHSAAFVVLGS